MTTTDLYLYRKFDMTGACGGELITNPELETLSTINDDMIELMEWRGDSTMAESFRETGESIRRMIEARKE
jgi:hypothetical protein